MNFKYSLDRKTPTKLFKCPLCRKNTFKRYWNNEQNEYFFDIKVGRCNRESNCGYHQSPKQYFEENNLESPVFIPNKIQLATADIPLPTYIDKSSVERAFKRNLPNYFTDYLKKLFKDDLANYLLEKFKISPSNHWKGSSIFWQIDQNHNVRTGKVMLYDAHTGKRVKEPFNHIHWVHSLAKYQDFHLKQCLFGLHQIRSDLDKTIGIVESEKTAILLTAIYPKLTWLASGGMNLSLGNFEPLKDRKIILYPDAGKDNKGNGTPFEKWTDKAEILALSGFDVTVSTIIENVATQEQRAKGYDLADYLIKTDSSGLALAEGGYPAFWDF
jgi:Domain of unknown function (DUF6371)